MPGLPVPVGGNTPGCRSQWGEHTGLPVPVVGLLVPGGGFPVPWVGLPVLYLGLPVRRSRFPVPVLESDPFGVLQRARFPPEGETERLQHARPLGEGHQISTKPMHIICLLYKYIAGLGLHLEAGVPHGVDPSPGIHLGPLKQDI